jgi:ribonuclease-3
VWNLLKLTKSSSKDDQKLITAIRTIAGFTPSNLALYKLATLHSSKGKEKEGFRESNERLEYLGDAILGAAVADYLFKKYPFKDEGFLTEIRSRIVNRESLNNLARKVGIGAIVQFDNKNAQLQQVILGNTLEALVNSNSNHKSKIIEWAQRNSKEIKFEILNVKNGRNSKEFSAQVFIAEQPYGLGYGYTKKKAEQDAAQKTCEMLNIE